jgi:hypothetical protein
MQLAPAAGTAVWCSHTAASPECYWKFALLLLWGLRLRQPAAASTLVPLAVLQGLLLLSLPATAAVYWANPTPGDQPAAFHVVPRTG